MDICPSDAVSNRRQNLPNWRCENYPRELNLVSISHLIAIGRRAILVLRCPAPGGAACSLFLSGTSVVRTRHHMTTFHHRASSLALSYESKKEKKH